MMGEATFNQLKDRIAECEQRRADIFRRDSEGRCRRSDTEHFLRAIGQYYWIHRATSLEQSCTICKISQK